jgi:hypothetical protein
MLGRGQRLATSCDKFFPLQCRWCELCKWLLQPPHIQPIPHPPLIRKRRQFNPRIVIRHSALVGQPTHQNLNCPESLRSMLRISSQSHLPSSSGPNGCSTYTPPCQCGSPSAICCTAADCAEGRESESTDCRVCSRASSCSVAALRWRCLSPPRALKRRMVCFLLSAR